METMDRESHLERDRAAALLLDPIGEDPDDLGRCQAFMTCTRPATRIDTRGRARLRVCEECFAWSKAQEDPHV
jgi:hypothetical protein